MIFLGSQGHIRLCPFRHENVEGYSFSDLLGPPNQIPVLFLSYLENIYDLLSFGRLKYVRKESSLSSKCVAFPHAILAHTKAIPTFGLKKRANQLPRGPCFYIWGGLEMMMNDLI